MILEINYFVLYQKIYQQYLENFILQKVNKILAVIIILGNNKNY